MSAAGQNRADALRLADREWRLTIGGEACAARDGRAFEVESPIDGAVVARVPDGGEADALDAVASASEAAESWRQLGLAGRSALLHELADVIDANARELALLDVLDCGAALGTMRGDVAAGARRFRYFAGIAPEVKGATIPASAGLHLTEHEPFGAVARIIPFNHPFMFASTKVAAPLVMGNSVVLKPAEATPLSALRLGELASEVLPPGVLSVVVGDGPDVPRALVRHPDVHRVGFTGSERVGRAIQRDAAEVAVKEVSLELGGKNALLAFPDADPRAVAASAVAGMNFAWSGQSCGSTSRLLVHRRIAGAVVAAIVEELEAIPFRSPWDPDAQLGALSSRAQYEKARRLVVTALGEGARAVTGGDRPAGAPETGYYVAPTVLVDVEPSSTIAQEEVFGPVLSVIEWDDPEEAIAIANGVRYGLTASIWTNDLRTAHRVARRLDAGFVWINGSASHFPGVPFGGVKNSGVGREESIEELLSYTRLKATNIIL